MWSLFRHHALTLTALAPLLAVATPAQAPPEALSVEQVVARAQANEPAFAAAVAEFRALSLERTSARAALLPTATYHNQFIYTQPNGVPASRIGQVTGSAAPIFIANNAVHEYASQGVFTENLGMAQFAAIKVADANAARAAAELEVTSRGLASTAVTFFYTIAAASAKLTVAKQAEIEARHFLDITLQRETAREVAHADVLKAELQTQQRERDVANAEAAVKSARIELGALLYTDPTTAYTLQTEDIPALPSRTSVETLAHTNNPTLRSALAGVQISQAETTGAKAALLPDLTVTAAYGIDATNFGVNGPDGIRNLGYSVGATLDIPVWDWLTTERRIKAAHMRSTAAQSVLTAAQRRLLAQLAQFYMEAEVASVQLASLQRSVATANEALHLVTLRYVDGESTVLEVVDAQTTLTGTQNAQVEGQMRYRLALANLQTLTGKL